MGYKFNPFTGNLDTVDSPNGVFEAVEVNGDITLDDGGTYTTTLQTITPTLSNKTISLPDATGTVALVAGSSGQLVYNNAGAQAGVPGSVVGATGNVTLSLNGAASVSPFAVTGSWFAGTTPQVLIQPSNVGTTGAWSASGTGIGVNAVTGFTGRLLDLQVNGTSRAVVTGAGDVGIGTTSPGGRFQVALGTTYGIGSNWDNSTAVFGGSLNTSGALGIAYNDTYGTTLASIVPGVTWKPIRFLADGHIFGEGTSEYMRIDGSGRLLVGTTTNTGDSLFQVNDNRIRIATAKTPASATATGSAGEICWDADYIYVCTATNTWKRTAISTW